MPITFISIEEVSATPDDTRDDAASVNSRDQQQKKTDSAINSAHKLVAKRSKVTTNLKSARTRELLENRPLDGEVADGAPHDVRAPRRAPSPDEQQNSAMTGPLTPADQNGDVGGGEIARPPEASNDHLNSADSQTRVQPDSASKNDSGFFDMPRTIEEIRRLLRGGRRNNLVLGQKLNQAKSATMHGEFGKFIRVEIGMSLSAANAAMKVAAMLAGREIPDSVNAPWECFVLLSSARDDGRQRKNSSFRRKLSDTEIESLLEVLLGSDPPRFKDFRKQLIQLRGGSSSLATQRPEQSTAIEKFDDLLSNLGSNAYEELLRTVEVIGPSQVAKRLAANCRKRSAHASSGAAVEPSDETEPGRQDPGVESRPSDWE